MYLDELYKLASLFEKTAQEPDQELDSPNVVIEPVNSVIDKAVKILQRMEPNYFVGSRRIVISMEPNYGHVESGPGKDPAVINININRILNESGGDTIGSEAVIATATTIAHEKGHVGSFDSEQGFVGGEGPAEAEEQRVRSWIEANMGQLQDLI